MGMMVISYTVLAILHCSVAVTVLFVMSGCVTTQGISSIGSAVRRIVRYLASGPITLAFALLICVVELAVTVGGVREQVRLGFGLPNDNLWAFLVYGFLHSDLRHIFGNVSGLLVCGALVEQKIGKILFLVMVTVFVPLGGFLTTLTAPVFLDSPWEEGPPSIGFSIVGNSISVLCAYLVALLMWDGIQFRQMLQRLRKWLEARENRIEINPLQWSARTNQSVMLVILLGLFSIEIDEGPGESILGHSIGVLLGLVAALSHLAVCLIRRRRISAGTRN